MYARDLLLSELKLARNVFWMVPDSSTCCCKSCTAQAGGFHELFVDSTIYWQIRFNLDSINSRRIRSTFGRFDLLSEDSINSRQIRSTFGGFDQLSAAFDQLSAAFEESIAMMSRLRLSRVTIAYKRSADNTIGYNKSPTPAYKRSTEIQTTRHATIGDQRLQTQSRQHDMLQ